MALKWIDLLKDKSGLNGNLLMKMAEALDTKGVAIPDKMEDNDLTKLLKTKSDLNGNFLVMAATAIPGGLSGDKLDGDSSINEIIAKINSHIDLHVLHQTNHDSQASEIKALTNVDESIPTGLIYERNELSLKNSKNEPIGNSVTIQEGTDHSGIVVTITNPPLTPFVTKGQKFEFKHTISGTTTNDGIAWMSLAPECVSVTDDGKAEVIGEPNSSAIIACVSLQDSNKYAALAMKVVEEIGSIELSKESHTFKVGEKFTLTATVKNKSGIVLPNATVIWTEEGNLNELTHTTNGNSIEFTALKVGSVTIKATYGGITTLCNITIEDASNVIEITNIEFSGTSTSPLSLDEIANLLSWNACTQSVYFSETSGAKISDTNCVGTHAIDCRPGDRFNITDDGYTRVAFYKSNKPNSESNHESEFITGLHATNGEFTVPNNSEIKFFRISIRNNIDNQEKLVIRINNLNVFPPLVRYDSPNSAWENGYYWNQATGIQVPNPDFKAYKEFIPVTPGKYYSKYGSQNSHIVYYNDAGTRVGGHDCPESQRLFQIPTNLGVTKVRINKLDKRARMWNQFSQQGKIYYLEPKFTPSNTTQRDLTWSTEPIDNSSIDNIEINQDGRVIVTGPGKWKLKVHSTNKPEVKYETTINITK